MTTASTNHEALKLLTRRVGLGHGYPEGLGVLGPIGNSGTIGAGKYKVTGDGVNIREQPLFSSRIVSTANSGDTVEATGEVKGDASPGTSVNPRGELVNFAHIIGPVDGWIAVEYLANLDWQGASYVPISPYDIGKAAGREVSGGGGGGATATANVSAPAGRDLTMPILIGAGVLAAGVVGYAVLSKKGLMGGGKKRKGSHRSRGRKSHGNVKR